jgi:hypothetical protein
MNEAQTNSSEVLGRLYYSSLSTFERSATG